MASAGPQYTPSRMSNANAGAVDASDAQKDGDWEVFAKKNKNRASSSSVRPRGGPVGSLKSWNHQDVQQKSHPGRGSFRGNHSGYMGQNQTNGAKKLPGKSSTIVQQPPGNGCESTCMNIIPPPPQNGWQWASRMASYSSESSTWETGNVMSKLFPQGPAEAVAVADDKQAEEDTDDEYVDSDDESLEDDEYDSDDNKKDFETRKKSKWFKSFFETLDTLTVEELNDATRQWHCPACVGGAGAVLWYKGFQPLLAHAKTKGAGRRKLHRELANLLEQEIENRGVAVIPSGEVFGKWKGIKAIADHEIVWPPMVLIRNTLLEKDENEKWIGMGNQELLDYFDSFAASKARHSYGPQGHRGISILIFESTAVGYVEAERLHKHFAEQGTDKDAWENAQRRKLFYPGGKRQLYGWLATKEDLDNFNLHCQGKSKLKFELRSYQKMVVEQMKQMSEDNQQLIYFKNKTMKQQQHSKALEATVGAMSAKLRIASEENRIVRLRTVKQCEENKEEMDYMERFFKEKMAAIHEALEEKERAFEQSLQEERAKVELKKQSTGNEEEYNHRHKDFERFISDQSKEVEEFEAEREKLIKFHEDKKTQLKRRHYDEELELEKEFDAAITQLLTKYSRKATELHAALS